MLGLVCFFNLNLNLTWSLSYFEPGIRGCDWALFKAADFL